MVQINKFLGLKLLYVTKVTDASQTIDKPVVLAQLSS